MILIGCGPAGELQGGSGVGGHTAARGGLLQGASGSGGSAGAQVVSSNVGLISVEGVTTWKENATAAYSIIHDDACDYTLDSLFTVADPELVARGLRAGFGAIVERCQERNVWAKLEVLVSHGQEILCHSWTHPDFVDDKPDLSVQIDQATSVLAANIPDQKLQYFIFPYDSFSQPMIDHLGTIGYTGARAGGKGVTAADFPDPLREDFDVYGDVNSVYYPAFPDVMKAYVDDAISQGGWAIREFHGIADQSWEPVTTADYEAHLDYVKAKVDAGELWVDTPSTVGHYRFARQYCGVPSVTGAVLSFGELSAQCASNATALSVIVDTGVDAATLSATQGGKALPSQRLGTQRYMIDIDPSLGDVVLSGS